MCEVSRIRVMTRGFFKRLKKSHNENNNPVRLDKKEPQYSKPRKKVLHKPKIKKKYNYTNILIVMTVILLLLICVLVVYQNGALESTNYYYRLH